MKEPFWALYGVWVKGFEFRFSRFVNHWGLSLYKVFATYKIKVLEVVSISVFGKRWSM